MLGTEVDEPVDDDDNNGGCGGPDLITEMSQTEFKSSQIFLQISMQNPSKMPEGNSRAKTLSAKGKVTARIAEDIFL